MANQAKFPVSKTSRSLLFDSNLPLQQRANLMFIFQKYLSPSQVQIVIVALPKFVNLNKFSKAPSSPGVGVPISQVEGSLLEILKSNPKRNN